MKRITTVVGLSLTAVGLAAGPALAANPHYVTAPTLGVTGGAIQQATVSGGKVSGIGVRDVTFTLTATGTGRITCTNPGGNIAPGQSQNLTTVASATVTPTKNGTVAVPTLTTPAPVLSSPGQGCPNAQWRATIVSYTIRSATLTATQNGRGISALTVTRTF